MRLVPAVLVPLAAGLLLLACTPRPRLDAADVRAGRVRLDAALDRALSRHAEGDREGARRAWREAHQTWDDQLAPGLEAHLDRLEVVRLELHLGRIRVALDAADGDPGAAVDRWRHALASPLSALPAAPGAPGETG
jgi:hypothetical protein